MYGAECIRHNPFHFFKFSHPPEHPLCIDATTSLFDPRTQLPSCTLSDTRTAEIIAEDAKSMIVDENLRRTFAWGAFASAALERLLTDNNEPDRERVLYRGIRTDKETNYFVNNQVNLSSSYASTSRNKSIAKWFAARSWRAGKSYLLHLNGCEVIPQVHMKGRVTYYDYDEEEVILPRNTMFKVTGVNEEEDMTIVHLQATRS